MMAAVLTASATTYTVAGVSAVVNGAEWDPANTANDMTSSDGTNYQLTVTGKTLKAGVNYEYKVVEDHAWTVSYPQNGNTSFSVSANGVYTINYSYKVGDALPTVTTVKTSDAEIGETVWSVIGTINGDWDTDTDMTKDADGIYSATFTDIAAGEYKFKVRADHDWTEAYPSSDYALNVSADNSTVTIKFNATSHAITVDVNGAAEEKTYTVAGTYRLVGATEDDDVVGARLFGTVWDASLTANDMKASGNSYRWANACVFLPQGNAVYKVCVNHAWTESYGDGEANKVSTEIPAPGFYDFSISFDPATKNLSEAFTLLNIGVVGSLVGSWDNDVLMTYVDGVYELTVSDVASGSYEFKVRANKSWNWADWGQGGRSGSNVPVMITADKADVNITFDPIAETVSFELSEAAGISTLTADSMKDAARYNLQGQRVGNGYRGVTVMNGKKYMVK